MESANIYAAWISILFGFIGGSIAGLRFHKAEWLGGYESWARRMLRLAHISLFGIAFLNLAAIFSADRLHIPQTAMVPVLTLFLLAQITMPLVCYLSAYRQKFRHFFPIPVVSLLGGTLMFLYAGLVR